MSPSVRLAFPVKARELKPQAASQAPRPSPSGAPPTTPTKLARRLALAHHVQALIESGVLDGYAEAARQLGMTRAAMTHVINLLLLSPEIQERILAGEFAVPERRLRVVSREADWRRQALPLQTRETWAAVSGPEWPGSGKPASVIPFVDGA